MRYRRSVIFDATVTLVFDGALVLSAYLLFAGHNQPGGGFVGGLVAAGAIALHYVAGGGDQVRSLLGVQPWTLLSIGLALAVGTAVVPVLFGANPLDQEAYQVELLVLGKAKATTALVFDAGVYLVVVGLMLMILEGLGLASDEPLDDGEVER
ncbi:MAG: MnhB domain-containing protein [Acidimicrobiales bacterium]|nr:hypothetical protein [Actinomycetota bacterium]